MHLYYFLYELFFSINTFLVLCDMLNLTLMDEGDWMPKRWLFGFILSLALWSSWWAWGQDQWISQRFFTTQSVWLVVFTMILLIVLGPKHPIAVFATGITTLNMTITGLVYHFVLETPPLHFQAHLSHTILPLLMLGVFLFALEKPLPFKWGFVLLLYPLLYLSYFILFGAALNWYPYPFMDVSVLGLAAVSRFSLGVLTPVFAFLALLLLWLQTKTIKKDRLPGL